MWKNSTLNIGGIDYTYDVYQQHDINNCGPSSIIMTVKQATGRSIAIGFAQFLVGTMEKASGKRGAVGADARWHAWGEGGNGGYSNMDDLCSAMQKKWPNLNATADKGGQTHRTKLQNCTPKKPALAHVAWIGGGGHFIVCLGKNAQGKMVWLDPYYGVVECIDHGNDDFVYYNTGSNSFGKGTAQAWSQFAIYTNPS